jgi:hypothetical protein
MKILFLTSEGQDYLQDQVLIGLRNILGRDCVDVPRQAAVYRDCPIPDERLYGRGFTTAKILPEIPIDRSDIESRIKSKDFDLIIFGSIHRQKRILGLFLERGLFKPGRQVIFLDGEDNHKLVWPALLFGPYYKREQKFYNTPFVRPVGFSIPSEKLRKNLPRKGKLIARHVQCDEAYKLEAVRINCKKNYAFDNEKDYYDDIASSLYAVTMKKGGWDCMRHYEIAANRTVMAFYRLAHKPRRSAPHGLKDMENCIGFNTAEELGEKIQLVESKGLYEKLQENSYEWAMMNTCENVAKRLIEENSP